MKKIFILIFPILLSVNTLDAQYRNFIDTLFDSWEELGIFQGEIEKKYSDVNYLSVVIDTMKANSFENKIFSFGADGIVYKVEGEKIGFSYEVDFLDYRPNNVRVGFSALEKEDYVFYSLVIIHDMKRLIFINDGVLVYLKSEEKLIWVGFESYTPFDNLPPNYDKRLIVTSLHEVSSDLLSQKIYRIAGGYCIGMDEIQEKNGKYYDLLTLINDSFVTLDRMENFINLESLETNILKKKSFWKGRIELERKPYCFLSRS